MNFSFGLVTSEEKKKAAIILIHNVESVKHFGEHFHLNILSFPILEHVIFLHLGI